MNQNSDNNPFAKKKGTQKNGKEAQFFKWAKDQQKKKLSQLPKQERERRIESEKQFAKRMNS